MNHLAHVFLSFRRPALTVGNFMTDFMKGKPKLDHLPEGIQAGIHLHRSIDSYTDSHPIVMESKQRLYAYFGKYASVVVDIYYDHLLALNWERFEGEELQDYVNQTYENLETYVEYMPNILQKRLPRMIEHNWLARYGNLEDMERTFHHLARRAKFENQLAKGAEVLDQYLDEFNDEFIQFFPDLIDHSKTKITQIKLPDYPSK